MKEISIVFHHKISDSIDGLLLETESIQNIMTELALMELTISDVYLYGLEKNIYFLRLLKKPSDTRNHLVYYLVDNKIYIPIDTHLSFQLLSSDYSHLFSHHLYLIHPTLGMYQLDQMIDWEDVIYVEENHQNIKTPTSSVFIPKEVKRIEVDIELNEEEFEASLKNDIQSDEDWIKSLPFDLKKVLNGNKKEAEKLLQYLDKYPERIDKIGIPLDTLNTLTANNLENPLKYDFRETSKTRKAFLVILLIGLFLFFGVKIVKMYTSYDDVKKLSSIQQNINSANTDSKSKDFDTYQIPLEPSKEKFEKKEDEKSISSTGAFSISAFIILIVIVIIKFKKKVSLFTGVSLVNSLIMGFLIILMISFIVYFIINNLTFGGFAIAFLLLLGHSLYKFLIISKETTEENDK